MSSYVPLTERVAATLKRHAGERCHFDERMDERHAKELHELTDSGVSADDWEAVRPAIPSVVHLLKLSGGGAERLVRVNAGLGSAGRALSREGVT